MTQASSNTRARKPRPGLRGPGSKPAREVSTAEFSEGFGEVAWDRSHNRSNRRVAAANKIAAEVAAGIDHKARLAEAYEALTPQNVATATEGQRKLVRNAEGAAFAIKRWDGILTSDQRIFTQGFEWPGGWVVEGQYWRDKFVERGLRTWDHPYYQRMIASMGKASRGRLRTGMTKGGCVRQFSKLHGADNLYAFFCEECRDMFRLDCDQTFASEAEMRSWLAHRARETGAPLPHVVTWIPDDRFPDLIIKPHFWNLLPEKKAVWPTHPESTHRLLDEVISALTDAYECDRGGLTYPFHGKNPISPLTDAIIVQDTEMLTLGEIADQMNLTWDPAITMRRVSRENIDLGNFDPSDSNTWFGLTASLARATGRTLLKAGFDVTDADAFRKAIADTIRPTVVQTINPAASERKELEKEILARADWVVENFDPSRMDPRGRPRGACADLIKPTDDEATRQRIGQTYVAEKRSAGTRAVLMPVYRERIKQGRDHSRRAIEKASGRAYNTIKRHEFQCEVEVISEQLVALLPSRCSLVSVKGVDPTTETLSRQSETLSLRSGHHLVLRPIDSGPPDPGFQLRSSFQASGISISRSPVDEARLLVS